MYTNMNTSIKKPYRYKIFMNEQDTDKDEVGSSSLPRPTIHFNTNRLYIKASARFSKECLNSISHMLTKILGGLWGNKNTQNLANPFTIGLVCYGTLL